MPLGRKPAQAQPAGNPDTETEAVFSSQEIDLKQGTLRVNTPLGVVLITAQSETVRVEAQYEPHGEREVKLLDLPNIPGVMTLYVDYVAERYK